MNKDHSTHYVETKGKASLKTPCGKKIRWFDIHRASTDLTKVTCKKCYRLLTKQAIGAGI